MVPVGSARPDCAAPTTLGRESTPSGHPLRGIARQVSGQDPTVNLARHGRGLAPGTTPGGVIELATGAETQHYLLEARQMQALSFAVHIPLVCFGIAFPVM